tara:strand:- start:4 stop:255 length:252 start_codon:yes stop_codon:yes gene_type:complete
VSKLLEKCKFSPHSDQFCTYAKILENGQTWCQALYPIYYNDGNIENLKKCWFDYTRRTKTGFINKMKRAAKKQGSNLTKRGRK